MVASVFVNPTQFGPNEDFSRYRERYRRGSERSSRQPVAVCFSRPETTTMYPDGDQTRVRVGTLAETLEGEFRPGHFEGVATVVTKLFSLVGPCTAVFGRKDYQQLQVFEARHERSIFTD